MVKKIVCDKCGKEMNEDADRAEVRFEGHMMVREGEQYCMKCWNSSSLRRDD